MPGPGFPQLAPPDADLFKYDRDFRQSRRPSDWTPSTPLREPAVRIVKWIFTALLGLAAGLFRWIALNADSMVGKDFEAGPGGLKAAAE